jgi:hypothetical protein
MVMPTHAVWTGSEALVLGTTGAQPPLVAAAYDPAGDAWRPLAAVPFDATDFGGGVLWRWTGSEALAVLPAGDIYLYDPVADRWSTGATPPRTSTGTPPTTLVGASTSGALARTDAGWQWYDAPTNRWAAVDAPAATVEHSQIVDLDPTRFAALHIGGSITWSVFDADTMRWGPEISTDAPSSPRTSMAVRCDATARWIVCFIEGFGSMSGTIIDPRAGTSTPFSLGNHSNTISVQGIPWFAHAAKLLNPSTGTWEDVPVIADAEGFQAGVWTGTELLLFAQTTNGEGDGIAYVPVTPP